MAEMKKSKLILKRNPELPDFQEYVKQMVEERGFHETVPELFMLFLEECGEFAKAARKFEKNIKSDPKSKKLQVDEEAADVFIYLLNLCNQMGINLETAFRSKEKVNKSRVWQ